ncbi:hypothetical protein BHU72_14560 [Desulfuribacillus stibiiarsenatis]|uniref:Helicase ATP-binding domain-containing protein n=2 Tax=Desulfuribacillus stibiiarsenatis TaxID=1390249 RepID=A0A1E5L7H6_9FIRM|nr:hypothetical protein BHU72_14560 [Desulfuribacillus stibiiarsenatis]
MSRNYSAPAYLQPQRETTYYGSIDYEDRTGSWIIHAQPIVLQLIKRLFPSADSRGSGVARFKANKRSTGDLNWLMLRYPLEVKCYEKWDSEYVKIVNHAIESRKILFQPNQKNPGKIFKGILRKYQKEGLAWMQHFKKTLLADEVGLGKTVQFLALVATVNQWPVLLVVPKHLMKQWRRKIDEFLELPVMKGQNYALFDRDDNIHFITGTKPYELPQVPMYITHYGLIGYWKDALDAYSFPIVGFDEIHHLRHTGTQKYSAASLLSEQAEYSIGMSATPIYNYGNEIHSVLNIIEHHCLGDWESFSREWCTGYGTKLVAEPEVLNNHLKNEGLLLRRTEDEAKLELPPLNRSIVDIDMDQDLFEKLLKEYETLDKAKKYSETSEWSLKGQLKTKIVEETRKATGIAKAAHVAIFVKSLLDTGEKVLLYGYHHQVYEIWEEEFKEYNPVFIHGKSKNRDESLDRFMNGDSKLLVMSLRTGEGIDGLQHACRFIVFGELDWSAGIHHQCEGRLARDGQKRTVFSYYLIASNTSDDQILETVGLKKSQFIQLMGDKQETPDEQQRSELLANKQMEVVIDNLKNMNVK